MSRLFELLKDLRFGEKRSQRLVDISQTFLSDPPVSGRCRPSRGYTTGLFLTDEGSINVKKVPYPPTPISHIPGCGPYALDSYRIFCTGDDEWKKVRPTDKELTRYLVSLDIVLSPQSLIDHNTLAMALGNRSLPEMGSTSRPWRTHRP